MGKAPFKLITPLNICLLGIGSVLVRVSVVPYKHIPLCMYIVREKFWIGIHVNAQNLKIVQ